MSDNLNCGNPDHTRPVPAVARLFWPDGRFKPATACKTDLPRQIRASIEDGHPVEIWPIRKGPDNPLRWGAWRQSPDCGRCNDRGRFREENSGGGITEAHCTCKRGQRMSELWYADKHGYSHPDAPEPEPEPDWDPEGPPF